MPLQDDEQAQDDLSTRGILVSVKGIKLVVLDDLDQHICIALIRSISAELQALSPTAIVVVAKSKEALIATRLEELGVVIIAFLCRRVATEAVIGVVISSVGTLT